MTLTRNRIFSALGPGLWALGLMGVYLIAQEPAVVRVTAARANVRSEASEKAPVLDQVMAGAVLELVSAEGDWFHVRLPPDPRLGGARVTGYLSRKLAVQITRAETTGALSQARQARGETPGAGMKVGVDSGGKTTWLPAASVRAVAIAGSPAKLSDAASAAVFDDTKGMDAVTPGPQGGVTWVWAAAPVGTPVGLTGRPSFFAAYTGVNDINLSEVVPALVRLAPGSRGWRVLGMSPGRAGAEARDVSEWVIARDLKQDAIAGTLSGSGPGLVELRPRQALEPGEYAIVLRPAVAKAYSGREILGEYGVGRVFGVAWVFKVK